MKWKMWKMGLRRRALGEMASLELGETGSSAVVLRAARPSVTRRNTPAPARRCGAQCPRRRLGGARKLLRSLAASARGRAGTVIDNVVRRALWGRPGVRIHRWDLAPTRLAAQLLCGPILPDLAECRMMVASTRSAAAVLGVRAPLHRGPLARCRRSCGGCASTVFNLAM